MILSPFFLLITFVKAAIYGGVEIEPQNPIEFEFLKKPVVPSPVNLERTSIYNLFFNMNVPIENFDFFGNEYTLRPDRILPIDSEICYEFGNINSNFRNFIGLISRDEYVTELNILKSHSFGRVDELMKRYYIEKNTSHLNGGLPFFPHLDASRVRMEAIDEFVLDIFRVFLPNLQGSEIHFTMDISGILTFLLIKFIDDLEGYFDEIKKFYKIFKNLFDFSFEIKAFEEIEFPSISREKLLSDLFKYALNNDLPYTLELFYALDLVDFSDDLFKYALSIPHCLCVLNRLFDFINWQGVIHVPEIRISTPVSCLHFIYEKYPEYLNILFLDYIYDIDWSIGEVPGEARTKTILGKILDSLKKGHSAFEGNIEENNLRSLLRELLGRVIVSPLLSLNPDRDVIEDCLENKNDSLKMLNEYLDAIPSRLLDETIAEHLRRIIGLWNQNLEICHSKLFKFLLKRRNGSDNATISTALDEAYKIAISLNPDVITPKSSPRARSSSEFFFSIFRESSSSTSLSSLILPPTTSPINLPQIPKNTIEIIKIIVEEALMIHDDEMKINFEGDLENMEEKAVWSARLADIEMTFS